MKISRDDGHHRDPCNGSASIGLPQSWNRYTYVGNDPLNFVDPSGLNAAFLEGVTCYVDGVQTRCSTALGIVSSGGGYINFHNVGGLTVISHTEVTYDDFLNVTRRTWQTVHTWFADGSAETAPVGGLARYIANGVPDRSALSKRCGTRYLTRPYISCGVPNSLK